MNTNKKVLGTLVKGLRLLVKGLGAFGKLIWKVIYKGMYVFDKYALTIFNKNREQINRTKTYVLRRTTLFLGLVALLGISIKLTSNVIIPQGVKANEKVEKNIASVIKTDGKVKESDNTKEKGEVPKKELVPTDVWTGEFEGKDIRNLKDKVYTEEELYLLRDLQGHDTMFIASIIPYAKEVAEKNGLYTSVTIAQASLESDWGRSDLTLKANNMFGVKARKGQESVLYDTDEDDGKGNYYTIKDHFAKYETYKGSFESYAELLKTGDGGIGQVGFYSPTWKENTTSYQDATKYLTGTYATDTRYADKLNGIIELHNLSQLDN